MASKLIDEIVARGLFDRLPATFSTYTFERVRNWSLLFPAEQSYFERLLGMFDRSDAELVTRLFGPLTEIERQMGIDAKTWKRREFSLEQVDFLQRSPRYSEWRTRVTDIFARVDPLLDEEIARQGHPRLVVVSAPSELPVGPDRMWQRIAAKGKRVALESGFDMQDLLELLSLNTKRGPYDSWLVEAGAQYPAQGAAEARVSYAALEEYRKGVMRQVRGMVEAQQIQGPQQLGAELRKLKIPPPPGALGADPLMTDFVRSVLLAGNGTLLLNNTFVEWASVQAIRRARPTLAFISFGVRNKVKPFSSLLIYTDQDAANAIPTQMDTLGTYVDLEVFYQYIWQECMKYPEYRDNTAYLFAVEGMDELLAIAPPDYPPMAATGKMTAARLRGETKAWLSL